MAQQTALSVMALPGMVHSFVAKGEAPEVEAAVVPGARLQPFVSVVAPPADKSFPVEAFYRALDNEARKQREVINKAYSEAEQEAEELKRRARYAKDEALAEITNRLMYVNLRMDELNTSKSQVRSMQMRRRLEDARNKIEPPAPKPKKRKDRTPKLTKLKKKQYKRGR